MSDPNAKINITEGESSDEASPAKAMAGFIERFKAKIPSQSSEEKILPAKAEPVAVPLVVYKDGERFVVGEALVDITDEAFFVEGRFSNTGHGPSYEALIMPCMNKMQDFSVVLPSKEELLSYDPIEVLGKLLED